MKIKSKVKKVNKPRIPKKYMDMAGESYSRDSAYKNAYALKLALKHDKKFRDKYELYVVHRPTKTPSLSRWFKEEWIQVRPYIKNKKIVACRQPTKTKGKACRPLRRIAQTTPMTLPEMLKKISKAAIMKEVVKKEKNPNYKMQWSKLVKKVKKRESYIL